MSTSPPAPSPRRKTVIEKIRADIGKFGFFIVLDDMTCHSLFITDGKIWWHAGDVNSRITATVASPFRTAKGYTCVHGPMICLPRWVSYMSPFDEFVYELFGDDFMLT